MCLFRTLPLIILGDGMFSPISVLPIPPEIVFEAGSFALSAVQLPLLSFFSYLGVHQAWHPSSCHLDSMVTALKQRHYRRVFGPVTLRLVGGIVSCPIHAMSCLHQRSAMGTGF